MKTAAEMQLPLRTLVFGGAMGIVLFGAVAVAAKLSRSHESLGGFLPVVDIVFRPVLMLTERLVGQSPLAAVGLLALLCLGAGIAAAYAIRWLVRW